MNISVCITVLNEEGSIRKLLDSLLEQTKKANEIIIADGGSTDKTIKIINHYQKKFSEIKLLKEKCTRSRGRNLAVEMARNEIIAMTDAGCVPRDDWLEKITAPFVRQPEVNIDVVAGFYEMTAKNPMQKAMRVFLGVMPDKFDINFLPSTRSIAFKKSVWEEIGGFPEEVRNSAEDTYFNFWAIKKGVKYSRVKDAIVEWGMPETIKDFQLKIYNYAKWDARTKIFIFPGKGLSSHNIKALFALLRYLFGLILLVLSFKFSVFTLYLIILISLYLFRSYRKARFWGIPLQFIADFAVMKGFIHGIFESRFQRH